MTETSSGLGQIPYPPANGELPPIPPPYCSEDQDWPASAAAKMPSAQSEQYRYRVQTSGGWDPDDIC